jgi:5-(carboxyamino)imidazole ribonucleotide mutase
VALDAARNAGILASQILALSDGTLQEKVVALKESQQQSVLRRAARLAEQGYPQPPEDL